MAENLHLMRLDGDDLPPYDGPPALDPRAVQLEELLWMLFVPYFLTMPDQLDRIEGILVAHDVRPHEVIAMLRNYGLYREDVRLQHLPPANTVRSMICAVFEIVMAITSAQAFRLIDRARKVDKRALADLLVDEAAIAGLSAGVAINSLVVSKSAAAGCAKSAAALKVAVGKKAVLASLKALGVVSGGATVAVGASFLAVYAGKWGFETARQRWTSDIESNWTRERREAFLLRMLLARAQEGLANIIAMAGHEAQPVE